MPMSGAEGAKLHDHVMSGDCVEIAGNAAATPPLGMTATEMIEDRGDGDHPDLRELDRHSGPRGARRISGG
jgi:hypothetical protein